MFSYVQYQLIQFSILVTSFDLLSHGLTFNAHTHCCNNRTSQVLVIIIVTLWATFLFWRLISNLKPPALLSSPSTSIFLIVALLATLLHCHRLSTRSVSASILLGFASYLLKGLLGEGSKF